MENDNKEGIYEVGYGKPPRSSTISEGSVRKSQRAPAWITKCVNSLG